MAKKTKVLTPREELFVKFFLQGVGKRKAAIRAGYPERGAAVAASKCLEAPHVRERIEEFYRREDEAIMVSREKIRRAMEAAALCDPSLAFRDDWTPRSRSEMPKAVRGLVLSARTWDNEMGAGSSIRIADQLQARVKYLQMFPAPVEMAESMLEEAALEVEKEFDLLIERQQEEDDEEDPAVVEDEA